MARDEVCWLPGLRAQEGKPGRTISEDKFKKAIPAVAVKSVPQRNNAMPSGGHQKDRGVLEIVSVCVSPSLALWEWWGKYHYV